jgi:hypothetical protein
LLRRLDGLAPDADVRAFAALGDAVRLDGAYRAYGEIRARRADEWVAAAFPEQYVPFASDWLGRLFALDRARPSDEGCLVTLLDGAAGETRETPVGLRELHVRELVDEADAAVALDLFQEWTAGGNRVPGADECVGYRTPLFVGGEDELSNLELIDMNVYWTVTAQLIARIRGSAVDGPV